ncbi:MAG TPA: glycerol-3-phosphate dehydrogenase/oxidase [Solirubrobacteraceae bacterium]|nr:glycerol-3-phosphate dehydrogenase/oxidase [Solirubrobacteraceae bacterium]
MPASSVLDVADRQSALAAMTAGGLELLIVGGGITGAGAALDAAVRGLKVGLVEKSDLASGTSSKSSKLIHGGLRYLEMGDIGLVREALRERELLLTRLAPHLVSPVPFLWPLHGRGWERVYLGAGLVLYDTLGGARSVARTAAAHGAHVATRTRVVELLRAGGGRTCGAEVVDEESGRSLTIPARHVALAVGAWTDVVRADAGGSFATAMRPSKGVHITVARERIAMATGVLARTEKSVLFVIPTAGGWLIGDTNTPWTHGPDEAVASGADIDYLLAKVNALLAEPLTRSDVQGVFAGLRPLVGAAAAAGDTTRLSRRHFVETPRPGLTTIAGGKYTTYRVMAADLIDTVARDLPVAPASSTERVPLLGAEDFRGAWRRRAELAAEAGVDVSAMERLLRRYGDRVSELTALISERPELAEPLDGGGGHLAAEVVYACTHEGALHLDDVLERRTRLALTRSDRGERAAGRSGSRRPAGVTVRPRLPRAGHGEGHARHRRVRPRPGWLHRAAATAGRARLVRLAPPGGDELRAGGLHPGGRCRPVMVRRPGRPAGSAAARSPAAVRRGGGRVGGVRPHPAGPGHAGVGRCGPRRPVRPEPRHHAGTGRARGRRRRASPRRGRDRCHQRRDAARGRAARRRDVAVGLDRAAAGRHHGCAGAAGGAERGDGDRRGDDGGAGRRVLDHRRAAAGGPHRSDRRAGMAAFRA